MPRNDQDPTFTERRRAETDARAEQTGQRAAMSAAAERMTEHIKNPNFISEIGDPEPDSDLYDWLEDEFGPSFAKGQILGYRDEDFPRQQGHLNANLVERYIAERTPGRILRQHPKLAALSQGIRGSETYPDPTDNPEYRAPLSSKSDKRRVIREASTLLTTFQSLAAEGQALESATTATTEHRNVSREDESGSIRSRIAKGVFG